MAARAERNLQLRTEAARLRAYQELGASIRQSRVEQRARNGGVMFGPNGAILPGDVP